MSVSVQGLYNVAVGTSGTGTGSEKFNLRWTTAVNRSLDEMSLAADLATAHSHITGQQSVITTLDAKYEWVLAAGVDYYLNKTGQRTSDPRLLGIFTASNKNDWEDAKGEYVAGLSYEEQATDSNSVMGLGYLG
jgi:hypothetical protein